MTFIVRYRFRGNPDHSAYQEALFEALHQHPLLCCRVNRRWLHDEWIWSPETMPQLQLVRPGENLSAMCHQYLDLRKECGLKVWLQQDGDDAEFIYQFHHACCDGIGALQFLADLAEGYALRTEPTTVRACGAKPELHRLRTRHHVLNRRQIPIRRSAGKWVRVFIREVVRYFRQRPAPLHRVCTEKRHEITDFPILRAARLSKPATRNLRQIARRNKANMNDVILRDLICTLNEWNARYDDTFAGRDLRILMPSSLRAEGDQLLPATNLIGYTFITRLPSEADDPLALLQSIRQETQAIRDFKAGWLFLNAVKHLSRPGILGLSRWLVRHRCHATAVHSHLGNIAAQLSSRFESDGNVLKVGNLELIDFASTPPVRPLTHVALATFFQAGQLVVNLQCDSSMFAPEHASLFLEAFVERLNRTSATL